MARGGYIASYYTQQEQVDVEVSRAASWVLWPCSWCGALPVPPALPPLLHEAAKPL
jgi:hypothetical protein